MHNRRILVGCACAGTDYEARFTMKVGDLVRCVPAHAHVIYHDYGPGIIVGLSKTGHESFSAQVKFLDDRLKLMWFDSKELEVISEAR